MWVALKKAGFGRKGKRDVVQLWKAHGLLISNIIWGYWPYASSLPHCLYATTIPIFVISLSVAPLNSHTARMSPHSLRHLLQAEVAPYNLHCGIMFVAGKIILFGHIIVLFHSLKLTSMKHYLNDHTYNVHVPCPENCLKFPNFFNIPGIWYTMQCL